MTAPRTSKLKPFLATLVGVMAAFAVVMLGDVLTHTMAQGAAGAPPDPNDKAALAAYVSGLPVTVLAGMVAGWTVAAFVGAWIAAWFGRRGPVTGYIVTGLFLAATVANLVMIPHPLWMAASGVLLIIAAGWLGARLGQR